MKKPSQRDIAILAIAGFLGILLGWAACRIWESRKTPVMVENPANEGFRKRGDSLEAVINFRDSLELLEDKKQAISDSILIVNNKTLKKDYDKYKELDIDSRVHYFDSLLSGNKVRR